MVNVLKSFFRELQSHLSRLLSSLPSWKSRHTESFLWTQAVEQSYTHEKVYLRPIFVAIDRAQLLPKKGADKFFMSKWELIFSSERSLLQFGIGLRKVSKEPLTLDQSYTEVTTISLLKQRKGSVGGAYYNGQHACFRTKPRVRFPALPNFF